MTRIAIDPITRIEGHLRIEVEVENGVVKDAWSSGTMFRGLELILKGRDPRDAWVFAQRACGVCTTVHALASVRAVENALELRIPTNARLIRNLIAGIQYVQDHVIHFYHLHALDWVDVVSALSADPAATAQLAGSISDWPTNSTGNFKTVQAKLKTFVDSGQLGPFANGYWGHPAYKLPPEANLMAVAHYLEALDWQRDVIKIQAMLGRQEPASTVVRRRRDGDGRRPELADGPHDPPPVRDHGADAEGAGLRRRRLHPRRARHRRLLQGLGRDRRRDRQLPCLRRLPGGRLRPAGGLLPAARPDHEPRPDEGRGGRPHRRRREREPLLVHVRRRRRSAQASVGRRDRRRSTRARSHRSRRSRAATGTAG